jgi:glycosyltransferase involved in cell wall biosynthesis
MKRLITIFPPGKNVHLTKDLGLIPYVLQRHFGYQSTFASYKNGEYPALQKELRGLNQVFIKRISNWQLLDVIIFLIFNFRKYDIIKVYHLLHSSWIWGIFFKVLTLGRGKVYIKLDAGPKVCDYKPKGLKRIISDFVFSKIDLVSIENKSFASYLNNKGSIATKIEYIPNGYYTFSEDSAVEFQEKINLMITVGRIGTKQKATEILCAAFRTFSENNTHWKLEIIGPVEPTFQSYIDQYFSENPHLINRVAFRGEIIDRKDLETLYRKAKIFVMTSRSEGFPHVFVEAIRHGCYIISSDIPAAHEITDNETYGKLFPIDDDKKLASFLSEICKNESLLESNCTKVQNFAKSEFDWIEICKRIDYLLN